ncbi:MAG: YicC/YloC family endoribonuclease [Saprospiraceae bacterium]|nr:YicC/YloC family endoribonuclease [Saprospiraceae bacterium]
MLFSMTGYGRATGSYGEKSISVELRAVNSKFPDIKMRLPADYKDKELELRKVISDHADRGKIDLILDVQSADGATPVSLNESLFRGYHSALSRLARELDIHQGDMLQAILRIPNVVAAGNGSNIDEEEWQAILDTLGRALDDLRAFRLAEGNRLQQELELRARNILNLLGSVEPFEKGRLTRLRDRIKNSVEEVIGKEKIDQNRFEQELLFYFEKMDITEEKVRLEQHTLYFISQIVDDDRPIGRTLNFISQEMGREINTLGAKAYDAGLQRVVVQMKEELEKIKEQLANVL